MTPTPEVQERLRQFLLGQLADNARDEFEKELMANDELYQELLIVEDEIVDKYLGERMSATDRAAFEKHFLVTPERHEQLRFGRAFKRYVSSKSSSAQRDQVPAPVGLWARAQPLFSSPVRIAAFVLIGAGIAFGVWLFFARESAVDKSLVALNAAYREQRPTEARISKFNYADYLPTRGGDEKVDQSELRRAELTLLEEFNKNPTPAVRHALGRVYLAKKEFDKAIEKFDEALKGDSNNAQIHSDLGAAWLEKGKIDRQGSEPGKGLDDFGRSLASLQQALTLNPDMLEALFNLGLVHQYMMLPKPAENDWREYLKRDSTSSWAQEAQRRLEALKDHKDKSTQTKEQLLKEYRTAYESKNASRAWEIVRHSRDSFSVGKLISDQLLDEYLEAANGNNPDAGSKFEALAFAGQLELENTGDVYTSQLARFYKAASPEQRKTLNEARELIKQGQAKHTQGQSLPAVEIFTRAQELFAKVGDSAEAQFAQFWIGYCYLNGFDTQRSVATFTKLVSAFERQNYKWLLMRTLHLLSGAKYNLAEYSRGIDYNRRALALAEKMGDTIGAFNALAILIEQYRYLGNFRQAMASIERSLPLIESCALNQVQVAQYYSIIATVFSSVNSYPAAADYQSEAIARALTTGNPRTISRAYANLGSIYGRMGKYDLAISHARLAYSTARSHVDDQTRKTAMAYASLKLGDLYRQTGDINNAIASYDEALDLNKSLQNYYGVYEAHKNRLFCYMARGDDVAANEEIKTTLGLVEKYRAQILEGDNRNHFFDLEQTVYDLAIDFEYSRMGNSEKAFEYSEASRARSLLDLVNSKVQVSNESGEPDVVFASLSQPLTRRDIQDRIPKSAQIVQYAVLNDKLLIWAISKTSFSTLESKVTQEELTQKVFNYLKTIAARSDPQRPESSEAAKELFRILIKPVEPFLQKNDPIYIVPDKVLNYLPFGALVSPLSNRFLVEDYLTVVSPSSSLLVTSSENARRKESHAVERLLSVGNPRFDRSEFPDLPDLPSAETEAKGISTYYRTSSLLTGALAGKQRVRAEMERSDVIHLAVHSFFDQRSPQRSKLLLSKQPEASTNPETSDSVLEANEIYRLNLSQARVVVLSACQSGVEQYYGGEGMTSLARPFLAASVPLVVASLWPVESDSTAELMINFHKYRKQENRSSAQALRLAQLDMLNSSDTRLHQPYFWSSFIAVGGATSF
ncbi:MAG TPA: CHAT domain-containing protein [Pyrinomonadaceae bacterium]|nr:CHAT domain-containing protein [Pyrinomonadaceae bacterium]